jgi:hypothetical protein
MAGRMVIYVRTSHLEGLCLLKQCSLQYLIVILHHHGQARYQTDLPHPSRCRRLTPPGSRGADNEHEPDSHRRHLCCYSQRQYHHRSAPGHNMREFIASTTACRDLYSDFSIDRRGHSTHNGGHHCHNHRLCRRDCCHRYCSGRWHCGRWRSRCMVVQACPGRTACSNVTSGIQHRVCQHRLHHLLSHQYNKFG